MEEEIEESRRNSNDELGEMMEIENELLDKQVEQEIEEEQEIIEGEITNGIINSVKKGRNEYEVHFTVRGEKYTNTIDLISDPSDPDEELNILCKVAGVSPGMVTQLKRVEVPVRKTADGFDILLPDSGSKNSLRLFRFLVWYRSKGLDKVLSDVFVLGLIGLYFVSVWKALALAYTFLWYQFDTYLDATAAYTGVATQLDATAFSEPTILTLLFTGVGVLLLPVAVFGTLLIVVFVFEWLKESKPS